MIISPPSAARMWAPMICLVPPSATSLMNPRDLRDIGFKQRFEEQYPGTRFATHMMPYAYDDFNMIVQAFEREQNPAVYIRNVTTYDGTAGRLSKAPGSGSFQSTPAVWVIQNGKPTLTSNH